MKRYMILLGIFIGSFVLVFPTFAQGQSDVIALNDATPAVDVVITPSPGTSGAVALEMAQVALRVTDAGGNTIFEMADPRAHALELRLAPDTGPYTLTAERLPGVAEAYIRVIPQADLTYLGMPTLVSEAQGPLTTRQEVDLPLSAEAPGQILPVSIPAESGTITATFPGAPVTAQVADSAGTIIAMLKDGAFDGLSVTLDGGEYQVLLFNTDPQRQTVANIQVMPPLPTELDTLVLASTNSTGQGQTMVTSDAACTLTINVSSVNLRSGPGTGYSVLEYGFRGEEFLVGGVNPGGTWLLIGTDTGSAWVSGNLGILQGSCTDLPVYNIPYREAPQPAVVVQQANPVIVQQPANGANNVTAGAAPSHEYEREEHEEEEREEHDD